MTAALATLTAIAAEAKIDVRTAGAHLAAAGWTVTRGKRYPRGEALKILADHVDGSLLAGHATAARGAGMSTATSALATARAGTEEMRREKLAFDLEVRRGGYLKRSAVEESFEDIVIRARNAFLHMGPSLAAKLVGCNAHEIAQKIDHEARRILEVLGDIQALHDEVLK